MRDFETLKCISISGSRKEIAKQHAAIKKGFIDVYQHCGLPVMETQSNDGKAEEPDDVKFYFLTPFGDETIMVCKKCNYTANQITARMEKVLPEFEEVSTLTKVSTPQIQTIQSLTNFLNIPKSKTAKAVFYIASIINGEEEKEEFIFVVVRGDTEVNEHKLLKALGALKLRKATDEEIKLSGAFPGFASPIGVDRAMVVVDDWIPLSPNLVAGANEEDYHYINVNYQRDYDADLIADIILAREGDPCPQCGTLMKAERGVCIGTLILIDKIYSLNKDCTYLDKYGLEEPMLIGFYSMGIERLLGCTIEENHDDDGLILPLAIAPYHIHLVSLKGGEDAAEKIYADMMSENVGVFFDDREESPGVKFKDADLMGMPLRITVSTRSLERGGVEWKKRNEKDRCIVDLGELNQEIKYFLADRK